MPSSRSIVDAHLLGPGLAAEVAEPERQVAGPEPSARATSAMCSAYEGVQTSTSAPRSRMSITWRGVFPPAAGTTAAPTRSMP